MASNDFNKPHFFLDSIAISQNFTSPSGGGGGPQIIPAQNRSSHSGKLRGDLATISTRLNILKEDASDFPLQMGIGIQVEFESFPDIELAVGSLADATHKIELHNVKTVTQNNQTKTIATVFIPDGKLHCFEQKITDYLNEKITKSLLMQYDQFVRRRFLLFGLRMNLCYLMIKMNLFGGKYGYLLRKEAGRLRATIKRLFQTLH
jgi:hypothetical protein